QTLALFAATPGAIDDACLQKMAGLKRIQAAFDGEPPAALIPLFGDLAADEPVYRSLFRNRAVRQIDPIFEPDGNGDVLTGNPPTSDHIPPLLAALRMSAADLTAITDDCARCVPPTDTSKLSLAVVSMIHRYAVLARLLGLRPSELIALR